MTLEAIVKDKGDIFEKPLNMNIHYSQTLVFKNFFFENHLHTLTKLPFCTDYLNFSNNLNVHSKVSN